MRPTDLGTRLEAHGFEGGPEPGMAADLRALPDVEAPTDVRISRVVTDTGLDAYEQVLSLGFGEDLRRRRGYARCMHASALVPTCLGGTTSA